jgi:hypothetical protein
MWKQATIVPQVVAVIDRAKREEKKTLLSALAI